MEDIVVGYLVVFVGAKGGICGRFQGQGDGWRNDKRRDEVGMKRESRKEMETQWECGSVRDWDPWECGKAGGRVGARVVGDGDGCGFLLVGATITTPLVHISCGFF